MKQINAAMNKQGKEPSGLEKAIKFAGGQNALARLLGGGVRQQHVAYWLSKRLPAERALQIEAATNGAVTRHELRPDLWPAQDRAA